MKSITLTLLFIFILGIIFPATSMAKLGVGVGLGKVDIDEELSPGGIYNLPTLPVLNTGDEDGEYEVSVTFREDQEEFKPEAGWFSFSPQSFPLKAGESQQVEISLTLPLNTRPGDYFAFLEASPKVSGEGVSVGVAAATKLNFTVKPANILQAIIERIRRFFEQNAPASYVVGGIAALVIVFAVGRRYVDLRIGLKKSKSKKGG